MSVKSLLEYSHAHSCFVLPVSLSLPNSRAEPLPTKLKNIYGLETYRQVCSLQTLVWLNLHQRHRNRQETHGKWNR